MSQNDSTYKMTFESLLTRYDLTFVLIHYDFPFFPFSSYCNSRVVKFSPDGKKVLLTITNEGRGRLIIDTYLLVLF